jgi:hypothetical protein
LNVLAERKPSKTLRLGPRDVLLLAVIVADGLVGGVVVGGDRRPTTHHRARELWVGSHERDADVERGVAIFERRLRRRRLFPRPRRLCF